ncbi:paraquat-inducible protein A [Thalassotalea piscium]|uniref:Putative paraquat-inducible protein A n=1 Tax=Thalassotalea piscium TaxID=1230533 RepID=A0A7X0TT45_9GAMM|nr:paraquat-inducible protein A [Thalassotalea piscium]MBB6542821.1 putative paraquat-inducible protein A [Thalassotalea piscium]
MTKHIGFILNIFAIALFIPGILLPMFSLDMTLSAGIGTSLLNTDIVNKELSLIGTIEELWLDQRVLVAILIFAFSICIPILKSFLLLIAYFKKHTLLEKRLVNFVGAIGKWSMADVFVVAIFLAVLSTNHAETTSAHQLNIFGFNINLQMSSETLSAVGQGFYYFAAYCLVSLLACQVVQWSLTAKPSELTT